jgi:hypothetical protein
MYFVPILCTILELSDRDDLQLRQCRSPTAPAENFRCSNSQIQLNHTDSIINSWQHGNMRYFLLMRSKLDHGPEFRKYGKAYPWQRGYFSTVHCREGVGGLVPQLVHPSTYLLTPWSRVLLEKLTSELCS